MRRNFFAGLLGCVFGSVILLLMMNAAGLVGAKGRSSMPNPAGINTPASVKTVASTSVTDTFTYQGKLMKDGNAITGSCNLAFRLYDDPAAGNLIGTSPITLTNVPITNGLFTVGLSFGSQAFNGDARWLATAVLCPGDSGFTALNSRQQITAAPYALGLVPGAFISGTVQNILTAFAGTSRIGNPVALHGIAGSPANLFPAVPVGVWGETQSGSGMGVLGASDTGTGVAAYSHSATANAISANNDGGGDAVHAIATSGNGVYASTNNSSSSIAAIYGENTNGGYGVYGKSSNIAVFAINTGGNATSAYLGAPCCAADLYGNVNVTGNLSVSGSKSGFIVDIAKSADGRMLSTGDVVAVISSTSPLLGNIPVALVVKADAAYQTGVIGIVNDHVTPGDHIAYDSRPITSGEYLSIVTLGMFSSLHVDASYGQIHAGDLLVASPHAGYAMKATDRAQAIGAIIGKAMGDLDSGTGTLPVLVTLQ